MGRPILGLTLIIAFVGADKAQDRQKIQGPWMAVDAMRNDEVADDVIGYRLTFKGETFSIVNEGKTLFGGTFSLDRSQKQPAIDFKHDLGDLKGKTWQGIYSLDGETLKICDNAASLSAPRPTRFESGRESGHVVVLFKRMGF